MLVSEPLSYYPAPEIRALSQLPKSGVLTCFCQLFYNLEPQCHLMPGHPRASLGRHCLQPGSHDVPLSICRTTARTPSSSHNPPLPTGTLSSDLLRHSPGKLPSHPECPCHHPKPSQICEPQFHPQRCPPTTNYALILRPENILMR